jgi:4'-phosphopantetheinyl transferase EntD
MSSSAALAALVPRSVAVVTAGAEAGDRPLLHGEERFVQSAGAARRRGFASGRACARDALRQLGYPDQAILADEHRAPVWPDGIVGSITHCAGFTAAAVARRVDVAMLGIDAEPISSLDDDVAAHVASVHERERASEELGIDGSLVLFSAKEAVYKAWYPVTRRWLDFDAVVVSVDRAGTFDVRPRADLAADDQRVLAALRGRFAVTSTLVLTAVYCYGVPSGGGQMITVA